MDMWGKTVFWHPNKLHFPQIYNMGSKNMGFFLSTFSDLKLSGKILAENIGWVIIKKWNNPLFHKKKWQKKPTIVVKYVKYDQIKYFKYPSMYFFGRKMIWRILVGISKLGYTKIMQ